MDTLRGANAPRQARRNLLSLLPLPLLNLNGRFIHSFGPVTSLDNRTMLL